MAKTKSVFVCQDCGGETAQWQGQCPACGVWNTLQEMRFPKQKSVSSSASQSPRVGYAGDQSGEVFSLSNIPIFETSRITTANSELDRVLGGGLVPGSVVLMGGHPGAGKSTLLLQTLGALSKSHTCLYITGEESLQQVALRAKRTEVQADQLQLVAETRLANILSLVEKIKPQVVVVDSIQVVHMDELSSAPGSVAQVRECAAVLTRMAKQLQVTVILVGHVTKEGMLAGPKVLEHIIDCSLLLESSQSHRFRILRSQKNRFGAVNEIGVFAMMNVGLMPVKNPSALFISQTIPEASGSVISAVWEGSRALLVEVQALVDGGHGGPPRRVSLGVDGNRLTLLLAVLNKQAGVFIADQDVFINLVGGLKTLETSIDLALVFAMVSSFKNVKVPRDCLVLGEIGLAGEVRPVANGQERMMEAAKHGFKKVIMPKANLKGSEVPEGVTLVGVQTVQEALAVLF